MEKPRKKCGVIQPLSEFGLKADGRDGHANICKKCKAVYYQLRKTQGILSDPSHALVPVNYCQGCGAPTDGVALCNDCRIPCESWASADLEFYRRDNYQGSSCDKCQFLQACHERVGARLWVLCEIPSQLDKRILEVV